MNDLFNMFDKTQCKSLGICSENPVLSSIDAVIINEIRQIAYYIVKLKELNLINFKIMKEAISALSVYITDTSFNKNLLVEFFLKLENLKKETETFYNKKCREMGLNYEHLTTFSVKNDEGITSNTLIKWGEKILTHWYNTADENKICLFDLIIFMAKTAANKLIEIQNYKEANESEYFEVLRLLSLTNSTAVRSEKLTRRIREFSSFLYKLNEELIYERNKFYGNRQNVKIERSIVKGKSIFVIGGDIFELYNLLEKTKDLDINIYTNFSMMLAYIYPKFFEYKNFKGLYGTGDTEYDFSKFKGAIYVTEHSNTKLDNAIRGKIFTTKLIPSDNSTKIEKSNLTPLIEAALSEEGFEFDEYNKEITFEYDKSLLNKAIEGSEDKKILISMGKISDEIKEKYENYSEINIKFPYDVESLIYLLNALPNNEKAVCFSKCCVEIIKIVISILNKNLNICLEECKISNVGPHILSALKKDFKVKL